MLTRLWNWLLAAVPSDEQLEAQDTPELREFWNRIEENRAIARRRVEELNVTRSPIHRRAS